VEKIAHDLDISRSIQIVERDFVGLAYGRGEVGVNLEAIHIANDQQRRIFESLAILEELIVSRDQVLVPAFVLPAKEISFPNVCPAVPATVLVRAAFESESFAGWIILCRLRMIEDFA
jgi:hypothetical protein